MSIDSMYELAAVGELVEQKGLMTKQEILTPAQQLKQKADSINSTDPSQQPFTVQENTVIEQYGLLAYHAKELLGRTIQLLECGKKAMRSMRILVWAVGLVGSVVLPVHAIQPSAQSPGYWEYEGQRVMLVGGSDTDHLFLGDGESMPNGFTLNLTQHLDAIKAAGGNYVRNTMSQRELYPLVPFYRRNDGKYDLNQWNEEYWTRLANFLSATKARDIIVQIEIWDRFDYTTQSGATQSHQTSWNYSPWNPNNNVTYTASQSGFASAYEEHPGLDLQPFFHGVPGHPCYEGGSCPTMRNTQAQYDVVRNYQKKFIDKMWSYVKNYDHVLFTMNNETSTHYSWGKYWIDYLQKKGSSAPASDMFDLTSSKRLSAQNNIAVQRPSDYDFLDISQVTQTKFNGGSEGHWKAIKEIRNKLIVAKSLRPVNSTKIYGSDDINGSSYTRSVAQRWGDLSAQNSFWVNIIGGFASSRFHRPGGGMGLNSKAKSSIEAFRKLEQFIRMWEVEPDFDHSELSGRGTYVQSSSVYGINFSASSFTYGEAYLASQPGKKYVLYFTHGGSVDLRLANYSGVNFTVQWMNIETGNWDSSSSITGGSNVRITAPSSQGWVAAIVRTTTQSVAPATPTGLTASVTGTEVVSGIRAGCYATICDQRRVINYESSP